MSGEKTEQPTQKKLDDSRKKGQVAQSKDIPVLLKIAFLFVLVVGFSDVVGLVFIEFMQSIFDTQFKIDEAKLQDLFFEGVRAFLKVTLAIVFLCALFATAAAWLQIGFLFAPEAITPSFKKFNAIQTLKDMFSRKSLVQLLGSVFKVMCFAGVFYFIYLTELEGVLLSYRLGFEGVMLTLLYYFKIVLIPAMIVFLALSALDWFVTHSFHIKSMRMSKNEVKDEYKQMEGNPEMKAHRKSMHRSLLNSSLGRISDSKVVVTNPTHIAVMLDYEPGVYDIPFVLGIETDADAAFVRKRAIELNIPVVQHVPLARAIYSDCDVGQYIKTEHLEMAAAVFKEILRASEALQNQSQETESPNGTS